MYVVGFFISCILLGLEYIHLNNVIHRDIKPENLVLDCNGYVKITDFGIAKYYQKDNANETSGTPGYMAPEVMWAKNHTKAVDYFALGIIGYEFMKGVRPYLGSRKEIKEKIMTKQAQITKTDIPNDWPLEAAHFINSLIQRKPSKRLGYKGVSEIKEHSWLKYYPWRDLYLGKVNSPFKPSSNDNYDQRYCNKPDRIGFATQERYENILENTEYNVVFKDFLYFNREVEEKAHQQHEASKHKVKTFKNPHYLYYEELTGNTESTDDQTVINRNILKNKAQEEEEEKIQDNKSNYYCGGDSNNNNNNNSNNNNVSGYEYGKSKGIFARSAKKSTTLFNMYSLSSKSINATFLFNNNNMNDNNSNSNSNNSKVTNIHLHSNRNNSFRRTHSKKNDLSINSSLSFKKKNMSFKSSAYYQ